MTRIPEEGHSRGKAHRGVKSEGNRHEVAERLPQAARFPRGGGGHSSATQLFMEPAVGQARLITRWLPVPLISPRLPIVKFYALGNRVRSEIFNLPDSSIHAGAALTERQQFIDTERVHETALRR